MPHQLLTALAWPLKNLPLAASNGTTILQQLTAANMALMASGAMLTAANMKPADALAQN
jgi:hypothetical protein